MKGDLTVKSQYVSVGRSDEAIATRSKPRPWRMEKLKMAGILKENPGFDFLMECWEDDPALRIVIKKLVGS